MYVRALGVWLLMSVAMVANGIVRDLTYQKALGFTAAHALSSVVGMALIVGVAYLFVRRHPEAPPATWPKVGALWLALTVAFEFGFGHYVDGATWGELLADYDLLAGRLWPLVLAITLVAPVVCGWWTRAHPSTAERLPA